MASDVERETGITMMPPLEYTIVQWASIPLTLFILHGSCFNVQFRGLLIIIRETITVESGILKKFIS